VVWSPNSVAASRRTAYSTDHGHGSAYGAPGGGIKGNRIVSEQVQVTRAELFQDRDYPVLNDCRALIGRLFKLWWGVSDEQLSKVVSQEISN
jgi:uncharacterized protein (DUF1501 family)